MAGIINIPMNGVAQAYGAGQEQANRNALVDASLQNAWRQNYQADQELPSLLAKNTTANNLDASRSQDALNAQQAIIDNRNAIGYYPRAASQQNATQLNAINSGLLNSQATNRMAQARNNAYNNSDYYNRMAADSAGTQLNNTNAGYNKSIIDRLQAARAQDVAGHYDQQFRDQGLAGQTATAQIGAANNEIAAATNTNLGQSSILQGIAPEDVDLKPVDQLNSMLGRMLPQGASFGKTIDRISGKEITTINMPDGRQIIAEPYWRGLQTGQMIAAPTQTTAAVTPVQPQPTAAPQQSMADINPAAARYVNKLEAAGLAPPSAHTDQTQPEVHMSVGNRVLTPAHFAVMDQADAIITGPQERGAQQSTSRYIGKNSAEYNEGQQRIIREGLKTAIAVIKDGSTNPKALNLVQHALHSKGISIEDYAIHHGIVPAQAQELMLDKLDQDLTRDDLNHAIETDTNPVTRAQYTERLRAYNAVSELQARLKMQNFKVANFVNDTKNKFGTSPKTRLGISTKGGDKEIAQVWSEGAAAIGYAPDIFSPAKINTPEAQRAVHDVTKMLRENGLDDFANHAPGRWNILGWRPEGIDALQRDIFSAKPYTVDGTTGKLIKTPKSKKITPHSERTLTRWAHENPDMGASGKSILDMPKTK